jgi:hypothetical protein
VPILSVEWARGRHHEGGGICFVLHRASPVPPRIPAGTALRAGRTQRAAAVASASRRRWGGELRTWLAAPRPYTRSLPLSPQPVGGGNTGGPDTWVPPSHPHSYTLTDRRTRIRAPASRTVCLADTQALIILSWPACWQ